jgi:phosphatidate phosphatase PAH1
VPVGKKIELDRNVSNYNWFNVESGHRRGWSVDWDDNWDRSYSWNDNTEYIMTEKGLKSTRPSEDERTLEEDDVNDKRQQLEDLERQRRELDKQREELQKSLQEDSSRYRYQQDTIITRPATERKVQNGEVEVKEVSYRPINVSSLLIERFNI